MAAKFQVLQVDNISTKYVVRLIKGLKKIPKPGHSNQQLSQRRVASQVPQELDMLESLAA